MGNGGGRGGGGVDGQRKKERGVNVTLLDFILNHYLRLRGAYV